MKKLSAFIFAGLLCLSFAGCGQSAQNDEPQQTPATTPVTVTDTVQTPPPATPAPKTPEVEGIATFFEGIQPMSMDIDADGYTVKYATGLGGTELVQQYVDMLVYGGYDIALGDTHTSEDGTVVYYYLDYTGDSQVRTAPGSSKWRITISVTSFEKDEYAIVTAKYSPDLYIAYNGKTADYSTVTKPVTTPTPTPRPTPKPTAKPAVPAQSGNSQAGDSSQTGSSSVNKNASYIPDFTAFLGKSPSEDKDRYYGGTRKYYQKLPLDTQSTVVSEVLALLDNARYQLELIEKVDANNRIEYNYRYTGNVSMDSIHSKNDESRYYNLQFTVYNKNNDNGYYGIHFHYAPQFSEENAGYTVSVSLPGSSGGGGGTTDFEGGGLPDHSRLQCLTCDGDGDCNKCGGSTYVGYGDARAKCDRCRGTGNCHTCGGTGTRS